MEKYLHSRVCLIVIALLHILEIFITVINKMSILADN